MDLVLNHTSTDHMWFKKAFIEKDNKYRDYYIVKPGVNGKEPNNWKSFLVEVPGKKSRVKIIIIYICLRKSRQI